MKTALKDIINAALGKAFILLAGLAFASCDKSMDMPASHTDTTDSSTHHNDTLTHHNLPSANTHHADSVALNSMKKALHHMKAYQDSMANTHNDPHKKKYYDDLFHKAESDYWHAHKTYTHSGTETIHDSVGHNTAYTGHNNHHSAVNHPDVNKPHDQHHILDSIVAVHHKTH